MIIAFDVTGTLGRIAWRKDAENDGVIVLEGRKHAETLLPAIDKLAEEHGRPGVVGVVNGPGSFTGVRIGLATAKGLRDGLGVPVIGMSHFDLARQWLVDNGEKDFDLLLATGRDQAFHAVYRDGALTSEPDVISAAETANEGKCFQIGEAIEGVTPVGVDLLRYMTHLIQEEKVMDQTRLDAVYIRPPDAAKGKSFIEKLLNS